MRAFHKDGSENVMIRATKEEWREILIDLDLAFDFDASEPATMKLVEILREVGIR